MPPDRENKWKDLGNRIREARQRERLTQAEVAGHIGVNPHSVYYWESGGLKPSSEHLVELASLLHVSIDWLLGVRAVEAELLKERNVSFMDSLEGLPQEDVDSVMDFIRYVRDRRTRSRSEG